jgi:hypothetical protein
VRLETDTFGRAPSSPIVVAFSLFHCPRLLCALRPLRYADLGRTPLSYAPYPVDWATIPDAAMSLRRHLQMSHPFAGLTSHILVAVAKLALQGTPATTPSAKGRACARHCKLTTIYRHKQPCVAMGAQLVRETQPGTASRGAKVNGDATFRCEVVSPGAGHSAPAVRFARSLEHPATRCVSCYTHTGRQPDKCALTHVPAMNLAPILKRQSMTIISLGYVGMPLETVEQTRWAQTSCLLLW